MSDLTAHVTNVYDEFQVTVSPGVTLYSVCDYAPDDRVYRFEGPVTDNRVVIYVDENLKPRIYADPQVEVIGADAEPIPEGLLDGPVGHKGDGSISDAVTHSLFETKH